MQSTNDVSEQPDLQLLWLPESAGEKSVHSYLGVPKMSHGS